MTFEYRTDEGKLMWVLHVLRRQCGSDPTIALQLQQISSRIEMVLKRIGAMGLSDSTLVSHRGRSRAERWPTGEAKKAKAHAHGPSH